MARKKDETSLDRPAPRTAPRPRKAAAPSAAKSSAKPPAVITAKAKAKAKPVAKQSATGKVKPKAIVGKAQAKAATVQAKAKAVPASKTAARKPAPPPAAKPKRAAVASTARRAPTTGRVRVKVQAPAEAMPSTAGWSDLGEQERVGAAKYGAGPAARGFDEQRFLFPRNYEVNRVRLVVRDPEWLFAYWDVSPRAFEGIRREMGERAMALSRLTLKVVDPEGGPAQVILLPYGARSWYVRIDPARPRYRAELGITLPSGQFRPLAQSNVVSMPRVGPSPLPAARTVPFHEAWMSAEELSTGVAEAGSTAASAWTDPGTSIRPGPLPEDVGGASDRMTSEMLHKTRGRESKGGASDLFRR